MSPMLSLNLQAYNLCLQFEELIHIYDPAQHIIPVVNKDSHGTRFHNQRKTVNANSIINIA